MYITVDGDIVDISDSEGLKKHQDFKNKKYDDNTPY